MPIKSTVLKISKEIKTALLVIASILLFIWGFSFLKGKDILKSYTTYYVVYDNVEGLSASAPVTINGLNIGKVSSIEILPTGKLLVSVQVSTTFPVSKTSALQIYEPGFIGGKQVALVPDTTNSQLAISGDTLVSNIRLGMLAKVSDEFGPLQKKVESTIVSADTLLNNINDLVSDRNKENLTIAIAEITQTMKSLNAATKTLNSMLANNQANIDASMKNLNKTTENFASVSESIAKADIDKTIKNLENTLSNIDKIVTDLNAGQGTMGKLMKDEDLYKNLTKTSKELELLLQDVRLNPTRYINVSIFGKKNKPYVAPE